MIDLVERLRNSARHTVAGSGQDKLLTEAADRIEALNAENQRAAENAIAMARHTSRIMAERDEARAEVERLRAVLRELHEAEQELGGLFVDLMARIPRERRTRYALAWQQASKALAATEPTK